MISHKVKNFKRSFSFHKHQTEELILSTQEKKRLHRRREIIKSMKFLRILGTQLRKELQQQFQQEKELSEQSIMNTSSSKRRKKTRLAQQSKHQSFNDGLFKFNKSPDGKQYMIKKFKTNKYGKEDEDTDLFDQEEEKAEFLNRGSSPPSSSSASQFMKRSATLKAPVKQVEQKTSSDQMKRYSFTSSVGSMLLRIPSNVKPGSTDSINESMGASVEIES